MRVANRLLVARLKFCKGRYEGIGTAPSTKHVKSRRLYTRIVGVTRPLSKKIEFNFVLLRVEKKKLRLKFRIYLAKIYYTSTY